MIAGAANGPDGFTCVVLDGTDVYVAGGAVVAVLDMTDMVCIKYNSSGTAQWTNTWNNNSYDMQDAAFAISYKTNVVTVLGATQKNLSPVSWEKARLRYNSSTGSALSPVITGGETSAFSEVKDIAMDDYDNIYVCGTKVVSGQAKNIHVVKYDADLIEVWSYTKNGSAGTDDEGVSIELSATDVFVSGYTGITSQGRNVYAAKLAQSNGAVSWEINNNLAGGDDEATGLQMDNNNNLIIPCIVDRNSTKDIGLLKLNHSTGAVITSSFYNNEYNRNDYARDIAINHTNNDVYLSAQVQVNDSTYESRIIKWKQKKVYSPVPTDAYSSYGGYIPNNTQLRETDSTANRTVRFYNQSNAIATYIDDSKICYQLVLANDTANQDTTYRVDMRLLGGKPNAKVYPYGERNEYINYYLAHMDKPSIRTPLSNVVLKQDVYDFTDLLFTSSPTGFRHWFVARDGAYPKRDYRLCFTGQTGLSIDTLGNLVAETTIGNIVYKMPKAYSMNTSTGELTPYNWDVSFIVEDSIARFDGFDTWSGVLVLEVDEKEPPLAGLVPESEKNMDWSTFFGSTGGEANHAVDSDTLGNVWYCGRNRGVFNLLVPGENVGQAFAFDDAHVAHFDAECKAHWVTYYGGNQHDLGFDIAIDPSGNSYCVGRTSSNGINEVPNDGLDDNTLGGSMDGFILKLDPDGLVLIDSYIGGAGDDMALGVAYRPQNNFFQAAVFIVGDCGSATDFPIDASGNPDGYDQAYAGGSRDGFLMELSPEGSLAWCTFLGSSGLDMVYDIADVGGTPIVVGYTSATGYTDDDECTIPTDGKFPFCAEGGSWYQEEFSGSKYFIARFNKNRELIYSSFIGNCPQLTNNVLNYRPQITTYRRPYTIGEKHYFYVSGRTHIGGGSTNMHFNEWAGSGYPNPYYGDLDDYTGSTNYRWIAKLYVEDQPVSFIGSTIMNWNVNNMQSMSIAADRYNGLIVTGGSVTNSLQDDNFCDNPDAGEFPLCDAGGQLYLEDDSTPSQERAFLLHFDAQMNIVWSTQFGAINIAGTAAIRNHCISTSGDYIFTGGGAHTYTLWDYDDESDEDYFRPVNSIYDATITRFSLPQSVIVSNEEIKRNEQLGINVFPNPTFQYINITLPILATADDLIEVYDTYGKLIQSRKTGRTTGSVTLDVGKLAAGMYILKYTGSGKLLTKSFVKE